MTNSLKFREPKDEKSKKTKDQKGADHSLFSVSAITRLLALPGVGVLLLIKTVCGVPIGILQSMFSVGENLCK